ncbi:hypothetical protein [Rhizorhapis suberifaciens]|uniref:Uncharacterized protein n=1 Tax=Rhizorhapis suberifaciens TaxID=13656 RepID=A0A840HWN5_9SPHN|nr:hypothetical protein [Rhizorhapis suberifaciens]MBB4642373.1 hypothetical protein [Rhizorhapis suberifaciens]
MPMAGLLPYGVSDMLMQQQPQQPEPFTWGGGGQRMTMDDIARERELAAQMQAAGADYSPVQHWTQGLARVAQGLSGGLREREANKASDRLAGEREASIAALLSPQAGGGVNPAINSGISSSDPVVQKLAMQMWERANPKPKQPTELQQNYEWLQGMGMGDDATGLIRSRTDPEIIAPLPGGTYVGPRSGLSAAMGGGDPTSGVPGAQAPTPPTQGGFADFGGASQLIQSMGAPGFLQWQQKHGTPVMVNSPEEAAALPAGTRIMAPDGRIKVKQ